MILKEKILFWKMFIVADLVSLSAGSDKNHAGDSTWWSTDLVDFDITGRLWWKNKKIIFILYYHHFGYHGNEN